MAKKHPVIPTDDVGALKPPRFERLEVPKFLELPDPLSKRLKYSLPEEPRFLKLQDPLSEKPRFPKLQDPLFEIIKLDSRYIK